MGEEKPLTGGVPRASDWYESRRVSALAAGERGGAVESNQVTAHAGGGGPGLSLHGEPGGGGAVRRSILASLKTCVAHTMSPRETW